MEFIENMDSANNKTEQDYAGMDIDFARAIPLSMCLILVIFATIIGNILVILAVVYEHTLRLATYYFIVSLAVADLMVGFLVLPMSAAYEVFREWVFGYELCVFWAAVDVLCCTASILSLVSISVDRYIAISRPMMYHKISTTRAALLIIFIVWMVSLLITIPPLFGWRNERTDLTQCELTSGKGYVIYSALGSFYLPLLVMMIVYSRIYLVALKQTRNIKRAQVVGTFRQMDYDIDDVQHNDKANICEDRKESKLSEMSSASQDGYLYELRQRIKEPLSRRFKKFAREKKAAKTLAIVIGAFVICWLPFFTIYLVLGVCDNCNIPEAVFKFFFWLGYCNSFLNPIIYPCLNKDFKRAFRKLLRRTYCNRFKLDYYDTPRRSMRVIRASRRLRITLPEESRSSTSPPYSPNLAMTRRHSAVREMKIRQSTITVIRPDNIGEFDDDSQNEYEYTERPFSLEVYDMSPRRPSLIQEVQFSFKSRGADNNADKAKTENEESNRNEAPVFVTGINLRNTIQHNVVPSCYSAPDILHHDLSRGRSLLKMNKATQSDNNLPNQCFHEAENCSAAHLEASRNKLFSSVKDVKMKNVTRVGNVKSMWQSMEGDLCQDSKKNSPVTIPREVSRLRRRCRLVRFASCDHDPLFRCNSETKTIHSTTSLNRLKFESTIDIKFYLPSQRHASVQTDITNAHFESGQIHFLLRKPCE